jgi:predicted Zn-dependent peptidase
MHIEQTKLPSGLTVATASLPGFESAAVAVVVRAGSRDEAAANSGVAHFLEHMAFKGTKSRSALDIAVAVECMGAHVNAFTSQELTAYHINGLRENVPEAIAILGDVLTASLYADEDVALERSVIAQEIARNADDPHSLCVEGFLSTTYPDQPLGRPVLGDPHFVAAATRQDMLDFIARYYRTGNMMVVVSGDVVHADVVELVAQNFAAIPTGDAPSNRATPAYAGGYHRTVRNDFNQVSIALGFPSVPMDAPDFFAQKMLASALGGGMASPLFQEVRQKRGLVYGVGSGTSNGSDFGLMLIQAGTTPDKLAPFLDVACAEALRMTQAVGERDFVRARNALLAELATVKEKPFGLAMYLAGQHFRRGNVTGPEVDLEAVRGVKIEDLRVAATKMLAGSPTLSLVGPVDETDYLAQVQTALAHAA